MLSVRSLFTEYTDERGAVVKAAQDVSFEVPEGKLFSLLGPSGCGKTTTLRSIAGLERPTAGEIEVNQRTGVIVAKRLFGALDCGLAVNPALVENQIVGQMVQSTSRVLKEEVTFDRSHVTSLDWMSYRILRFAEHPDVVPVVVQRPDYQSTGAGEEVMGATAAAIANAFTRRKSTKVLSARRSGAPPTAPRFKAWKLDAATCSGTLSMARPLR